MNRRHAGAHATRAPFRVALLLAAAACAAPARTTPTTPAPATAMDSAATQSVSTDATPRPLSGRAETTATVWGAHITVDYGTPQMRGREIWGALVPWDSVWRTGANLATHFTTDRDLLIAGEIVPAGRYSLFSMPQPSGGRLIFNEQTDQPGTSYDASRDVLRAPMQIRKLASSVERLQIDVAEVREGGEIRILWDRAEFVTPFRVRADPR